MSSKPERFSAAFSTVRQLLPALVLVLALAVVSFFTFPDMDDSYLLLILKERGAEGIVAGALDRPLVGWLWSGLAAATGNRFWDISRGIHAALWIGLAAVAARLAAFARPSRWSAAALAGLLAVAPLAVRTQLSVVTIPWVALLGTVLAWAAALMLLVFSRRGGVLFGGAGFGLLALAVLYSEYALPVTACGAVLLLFEDGFRPARRRLLLAATVLAWAGLLYLIYRGLGDTSFRPEVNPANRTSVRGFLTLPLVLVSDGWRLTVGGLGGAVEQFGVEWGSRSTLLGASLGILLGLLLLGTCGQPNDGHPQHDLPKTSRRAITWLAFAAGLLPVAMMRGQVIGDFQSRFYIPLLPIVAVLVAGLIADLPDRLWRRAAVFFVGLVVGACAVRMAADAYRRQRFREEIGTELRPVVESQSGIVFAVVDSSEICGIDRWCTGQITRTWPGALTQRVWIFPPASGRKALGSRAASAGADVDVGTHVIRRRGRTTDAIWIDTLSGVPSLEPYWLAR
jgi:hypothetical protein